MCIGSNQVHQVLGDFIMDSAGQKEVEERLNSAEKRAHNGTHDGEVEAPALKKRKLEETNGEESHQLPSNEIAQHGDHAHSHGAHHHHEEGDMDSDIGSEDSEDPSFDEMMAVQQVPPERRGEHFEGWYKQQLDAGRKPLEVLGELGFKSLVEHMETDKDADDLIKRAIEVASETRADQERLAGEKATEQSSVEAVEAKVEQEKPAEEVVQEQAAEEKKKSALMDLFGDMDDSDLDDDSDDGSYDPTAAILNGEASESEAEGLTLTDPIHVLYAFSSHIRHSEDHLPPRRKLPEIATEDDAVKLIENANKILVLSGAGISVACGVPDFRSPGGLYDQIKEKYNLTDPQLLFDINYIRKDQVPFYDFAAQLFPSSDLVPSKAHKFIKLLQDKGKLLRNYSQNIDTLEQQIGIAPEKLILCHGSFATFSCPQGHRVDGALIKPKLDSKHIPQCEICNDPTGASFLKPDIVFFGEALPDAFRTHIQEDAKEADLLIVMGSSLRV